LRKAVVAEIVMVLNPLPQYFLAGNITNLVNTLFNDKPCCRGVVSVERMQNCEINRICLDHVCGSYGRKVVES